MIAISSMIFYGCESMGTVRANPVSMEINGNLFRSNPDTTHIFGSNDPEQAFRQYVDYFTFELSEVLYSKKGARCTLNLVFTGHGQVELNQRYQLRIPDEGEIGTAPPSLTLNGSSHEITGGWVEFTEYGTNDSGDRAYTSGTFGLTMKDGAIKTSNGTFGRMLECKYSNHQPAEQ